MRGQIIYKQMSSEYSGNGESDSSVLYGFTVLLGWVVVMLCLHQNIPPTTAFLATQILISDQMPLTPRTEADGEDDPGAAAVTLSSEKSLFRNTNLEAVVNARKLEREHLRDESHRKKEQDKLQREKDKLAKQERKEKEKKRTQKGERKR